MHCHRHINNSCCHQWGMLIILSLHYIYIFCLWHCGPTRAMAYSFLRFLDQTRHIRVGRTSLDGWLAHRTDLYLTTHTEIHALLVGFEPTIPAGERLQTYTLDRAATGTGLHYIYSVHTSHRMEFVVVTQAMLLQNILLQSSTLP